jgi:hypothetical protein
MVPQKLAMQVSHNIVGFAINGGSFSRANVLKKPSSISLSLSVISLHPIQKHEMEVITYISEQSMLAYMSADT